MMMVLEQIGTSGRMTETCVSRLKKKYAQRLKKYGQADVEAGDHRLGNLKIVYYHTRKTNGRVAAGEPVKSHLKLTIIDDELVILGSGNMDRASWYTSQELGIAFFSHELARDVMALVKEGLEGRAD
jgi:phosphatidylserine/phosphatidylglycerophosphate/cardiolipin synthase-like enzyme